MAKCFPKPDRCPYRLWPSWSFQKGRLRFSVCHLPLSALRLLAQHLRARRPPACRRSRKFYHANMNKIVARLNPLAYFGTSHARSAPTDSSPSGVPSFSEILSRKYEKNCRKTSAFGVVVLNG